MPSSSKLREWLWILFGYTTVPGPSYRPSYRELTDAGNHAGFLVLNLDYFQDYAQSKFPQYKSQLECCSELIQVLRDEHGGMEPARLLKTWGDNPLYIDDPAIFKTQEDKEAMLAVFRRWEKRGRLMDEFRFPWDVFRPRSFVERFSEDQVKQMIRSIHGWLEWRKVRRVSDLHTPHTARQRELLKYIER